LYEERATKAGMTALKFGQFDAGNQLIGSTVVQPALMLDETVLQAFRLLNQYPLSLP
jgi:hypothetical protein